MGATANVDCKFGPILALESELIFAQKLWIINLSSIVACRLNYYRENNADLHIHNRADSCRFIDFLVVDS